MADISNRTLVGLLVVAIVVSLAGTFISLNKLGTLSAISGAAVNTTTQTGTVNTEVLSTAQLTLQVNDLNFGSGQINATPSGFQYCELVSNVTNPMGGNTFSASNGVKGASCVDFQVPLSFVLENTGNTMFTNVTVNSSNGQAYRPILAGDLLNNGTYSYKVHEEITAGSGACTTSTSIFTAFSTSPAAVCWNFTYFNSTGNAFALQVNLTLPESANATSGNATDFVSFIGNL